MSRWISWYAEHDARGWACSQCAWKYPAPSLLADPEARDAFYRLANVRFRQHRCLEFPRLPSPGEQKSFADRVRELIARGYKPKDAADLMLREVELESAHDLKMLEQARADADEFLRLLRRGSI